MLEFEVESVRRSRRVFISGDDRDDRGWTLLHIHARKGDLRGVRRLLDEGMDANVAALGPKSHGPKVGKGIGQDEKKVEDEKKGRFFSQSHACLLRITYLVLETPPPAPPRTPEGEAIDRRHTLKPEPEA
ncbi:Ankyrin repeat family protein [Striga hermonthica]|uniref:Ankyrin repeat family protein n=1 Tax=Striga hermonthica TaxID=68872 RepID=A0A9N7NGH6_STRHE|nr:Ankyrin repeat family protein [Striga hermonthica]